MIKTTGEENYIAIKIYQCITIEKKQKGRNDFNGKK